MATIGNDPLEALAQVMAEACSVYVVDASLRVLLIGTSQADLAPPGVPDLRLPNEIEAPLMRVLAAHDFDRVPMAKATSAANVGIRCQRIAGPAGEFLLVMAQQLPAAFSAVA